MSLIPLPVWEAVNKDDAVLHQGLGSDQFVVGGIVDHIDDPGLTCAACTRTQTHTYVKFIITDIEVCLFNSWKC